MCMMLQAGMHARQRLIGMRSMRSEGHCVAGRLGMERVRNDKASFICVHAANALKPQERWSAGALHPAKLHCWVCCSQATALAWFCSVMLYLKGGSARRAKIRFALVYGEEESLLQQHNPRLTMQKLCNFALQGALVHHSKR